MKLSEIPRKGRRNALLLMAGLGTAAALALAPVGAGVFEVGQAAAAAVPTTTTTTVVTSDAWTSPQGTTTKVLVEHPYPAYTAITGASWIWANLGQSTFTGTFRGPGTVPGGTVTLSTTFTVPGIPQGATLTLAADNGATVYINTTKVATLSAATLATPGTTFKSAHPYTVTTGLVQGTNTITIVGYNATAAADSYNPAGVVAKLIVVSTSGTANLCKKTGWRVWTTTPGPFSNQGDCVSYFMGNGNDPTIPNTAHS